MVVAALVDVVLVYITGTYTGDAFVIYIYQRSSCNRQRSMTSLRSLMLSARQKLKA